MSTEAEIVEFEGKRYRVAGKSGPGVEPKVGMVVRWDSRVSQRITAVDDEIEFHTGFRVNGHRQVGNWVLGHYQILAPFDASPPAETPRCEEHVATVHDSDGNRKVMCGQALESAGEPIYCSACADRARAAASNTTAAAPNIPPNIAPQAPNTGSPIPPGYRLADGWKEAAAGRHCVESLYVDGHRREKHPAAFYSPAILLRGPQAVCLDCAERRGAIERVEAVTCMRAGCDKFAAANGLCAAHGEQSAKLRAAAPPAKPKTCGHDNDRMFLVAFGRCWTCQVAHEVAERAKPPARFVPSIDDFDLLPDAT